MSSAKRTPRYTDAIRPFEVVERNMSADVIRLRPEPFGPALPPITEHWPRAKAVPLARRPWQLLLVPPTPGAPTRTFHVARWHARLVLGAMAVLLAIQAPWMGLFIDYYQTDSDASITLYKGWGLRLAGDVAWIIGAAVTGFLAYRYARSRYGWMLNIVFQLAALPRLLPTNLALLLSAPLPTRKTRQRESRERETQTEATSSA